MPLLYAHMSIQHSLLCNPASVKFVHALCGNLFLLFVRGSVIPDVFPQSALPYIAVLVIPPISFGSIIPFPHYFVYSRCLADGVLRSFMLMPTQNWNEKPLKSPYRTTVLWKSTSTPTVTKSMMMKPWNCLPDWNSSFCYQELEARRCPNQRLCSLDSW